MPLKLACPNCFAAVRLDEPYPLPGATVMCSACGKSVAVTYPSGVIEQLRARGKSFAEGPAVPKPALRRPESMGTAPAARPAAPKPRKPAGDGRSVAATDAFGKVSTEAGTEAAGGAAPADAAGLALARDAAALDGAPPTYAGAATAVEQTQVAEDGGPGFQEIDRTVPAMRSPYGALPNNVAEPEGRQPSPEGAGSDPGSDATSRYTDALPPGVVQRPPAEDDSLEPDPVPVAGARAPTPASGASVAASAPKKKKKTADGAKAAPPAPVKKRRGLVAGALGCFGSMGMAGFGTVGLGVVGAVAAVGGVYWYYSRDLPTVDALQAYEPPTVTVVTDRNGEVLGELFEEKRYVLPIEEIPLHVKQAFLAAEDANFYSHGGIDYMGIVRAIGRNALAGRKAQGASTITQQVARNFLLDRDKKLERKIKEILISWQIEDVYSKDHILYLYLNSIFLGAQAYGVEAASQVYFGKSVREISIAEAAILAGLPQRPSDYSPHGNWKEARARQEYVLGQMLDKEFITRAQYDEELAREIVIAPKVNTFRDKAPWFTEHVRRVLVREYGEEMVNNGGLRVKTTCDLGLQQLAQKVVSDGVVETDQRMGWRRQGVQNVGKENLDKTRAQHEAAMTRAWAAEKDPGGRVAPPTVSELVVGRTYDAVITQVERGWAKVGIGSHDGLVPIAWADWVYEPNPRASWRERGANDLTVLVDTDEDGKKDTPILKAGDVVKVRVRAMSSQEASVAKAFANTPGATSALVAVELVQNPEVESALLSMDLSDGAIRAMVGGSDFQESQFNRAIQARRQVGSTFKPIVYAAAIESKRVTAAQVFVDAPLAMATANDFIWKPSNYSNDYAGPMTVRQALLLSKNTVTVRIVEAADPGMNDDLVYDFGRKLGIGGPPTYRLPKDWIAKPDTDVLCPWTLETPESTICMDRYPPKKDELSDSEHRRNLKPDDKFWCRACDMSMSLGSAALTMEEMVRAYSAFPTGGELVEPYTIVEVRDRTGKVLLEHQPSPRPQVMDPAVASIATWLMEGVVRGGTAAAAGADLHLQGLAGKTGTTNDEKDAWFVGYSPDVITAVWTGYDDPKSLGVSSTGGRISLPIWIDYMKVAAPKEKDRPFPMRGEIEWANIEEATGRHVTSGGMSYPFLKGTVPESTGQKAGVPTIEDVAGGL